MIDSSSSDLSPDLMSNSQKETSPCIRSTSDSEVIKTSKMGKKANKAITSSLAGDEHGNNCNPECIWCQISTSNSRVNMTSWQNKVILESGVPNYVGCKIPVYSSFNMEFLKERLRDYSDAEVLGFMEYGWPVSHNGSEVPNHCDRNHGGATSFPVEIDKYLKSEVSNSAVLGPFIHDPFVGRSAFSPLNSVEKKDSEERRVILDLSYPKGKSVNDGIEKGQYLGEEFKLMYPTVDSLVEIIKSKGQGCLLFKRDLKRAFRQLPVDPGDIHLLGYKWDEHLFFDRVLPMGLRVSALACQRVTNAVRYIYEQDGFSAVNYQDDFGGAETPDLADLAFEYLGQLLKDCGLIEAIKKACPPSTRMIFLGILLDTLKMTLEVTPERLEEISLLINQWLIKNVASRKELESLVGKLKFVATCVKPGRIFLTRILNLLRQTEKGGCSILDSEFKKDLIWWNAFLVRYNGVSMINTADWTAPDQIMATDACPTGCGGIAGSEYFSSEFPADILAQKLHINALECLTITVGLKLWGHRFKGCKILMHCDNQATVDVVNSGKARDKFLQSCVREITYWIAVYEIELKVLHIKGSENRVPDWLSRQHKSKLDENQFAQYKREHQLIQREVSDNNFKFTNPW